MTRVQKNLIAAIAVCALILAAIYCYFMQLVREAQNPPGPMERVADPLGSGGKKVAAPDEPEVDMDKLFEEERKKQKGLGSLRKSD